MGATGEPLNNFWKIKRMPTYLLPETEYEKLITAEPGTQLTDLFPHGITFTISADGEVVEIRQPRVGDIPGAMKEIEAGIKRMNKALLETGRYD